MRINGEEAPILRQVHSSMPPTKEGQIGQGAHEEATNFGVQ